MTWWEWTSIALGAWLGFTLLLLAYLIAATWYTDRRQPQADLWDTVEAIHRQNRRALKQFRRELDQWPTLREGRR